MATKLKYIYILSGLSVITPIQAQTVLDPVSLKQKSDGLEVSVKREDFSRQANTTSIFDVIKREVGISSSGKTGEKEQIRLRGLSEEYTRINVDGIELPSSAEKRYFKIDIIPTAMVGEVKILRNTPASFNADGLGGRIDVKTTAVTDQNTQSYDISGGLEGATRSHQASFFANRVLSPTLKGNFSVSRTQYIRDKRKEKIESKPKNANIETTKENENVTESKTGFAFVGNLVKTYSGGTTTFKPIFLGMTKLQKGDKLKAKLKNTVYENDKGEKKHHEDTFTTVGLTVANSHSLSDTFTIDTSFSSIRTDKKHKDSKTEISKTGVVSADPKEDSTGTRKNVLLRLSTDLTKSYTNVYDHTFKTGVVYRTNNFSRGKKVYVDGVYKADEKADETFDLGEKYTALYLQNKTDLKNGWTILPGVRLEKLTRKGVSQVRQTNTSNQYVLPSVISNYTLDENTKLTFAYSKKLNRPTFKDLAPYLEEEEDEVKRGNPNLLAEKADSFDAGVNYNAGGYDLSANIFYRKIKDVIENVDTGETKTIKSNDVKIYQPENVGTGNVRGLELTQKFEVTSLKSIIPGNLNLNLNQTFMASKVTKKDGTTHNFKGQADMLANATLGWDYKDLYVSLSAKHEKGYSEDDGDKTKKIGAETYVDLYAQKTLSNGGIVYITMMNVLAQGSTKNEIEGTKTKDEFEKGARAIWIGFKTKF